MTNNQLVPIIVAFAAAISCWALVYKKRKRK